MAKRQLNRQVNQLTRRQAAFVEQYVANGGNASKAAKDAGYSESAAGTIGWKLLRLDSVSQEIFRLTARTIGLNAAAAAARVVQLASSARSEYVQLEAAKDILDRAGIVQPKQVDHRFAGDVRIAIDLGE